MVNELKYFCEWGKPAWRRLCAIAITDFAGVDLRGKRLLEIGFRSGRMSCLFALLGAQVTAIDINGDFLAEAKLEASKWKVTDRIEFMIYNGDLAFLQDEAFDIVFTKSVLVLVPHLESYLFEINRKLKPDGKVIFIENARGDFLYHFLRRFRPVFRRYPQSHFFTTSDLGLFAKAFCLNQVKKIRLPPIYLITGYKSPRIERVYQGSCM
ncbi:class I SAM-dependent methyltransferase [bacterium]|nr:MAG: class I SAM-dependent methyltransferase [bacterium]